jgi:chromosomal replication initiator protein
LREHLREELGWVHTHAWIDECRPRALERGTLWLEVAQGAARTAAWEARSHIQDALAQKLGRRIRLRLVSPTRGRTPKKQREEQSFEIDPERTLAKHDLARFITGPSNQLAAEFARQAVREPGAWHPLVFYGEPGTGKTHLLQGIVNGFRRRYPTRRAVYARSDRFGRQFGQALRRRQSQRFRDHYRDVSLLVIDDLEALAGKRASELELSHTLDHLLMTRAPTQVVIACRQPPKEIPQLRASLETRLVGGQLVPLPTPDRATRRHVLRASCVERGLTLTAPVEELLSAKVELSIRELLTAVLRLAAHEHHAGARLDLMTARSILRDLLAGRREEATLDTIALFVSQETGVALEHLRGRTRQPRVVRARHLAMGLTRCLTEFTLREIGAYFGGRSVASVHGGAAQAARLRDNDPHIRGLWEQAERRFANNDC